MSYYSILYQSRNRLVYEIGIWILRIGDGDRKVDLYLDGDTYTYQHTYTLLYKFFLIGTERVYVYGNLYVSSDLYSAQWNWDWPQIKQTKTKNFSGLIFSTFYPCGTSIAPWKNFCYPCWKLLVTYLSINDEPLSIELRVLRDMNCEPSSKSEPSKSTNCEPSSKSEASFLLKQ